MVPSDKSRLQLQKSVAQATLAIYFLIFFIVVFIGYSLWEMNNSSSDHASAEKNDSTSTTSAPLSSFNVETTFMIGTDSVKGNADNGKILFKANCARCHYASDQKFVGPGLAKVTERWENKTKLYSWIKSSSDYLKTGDAYTNALYVQYNQSPMPPFPLKEKEINDLLAYIVSYDPSDNVVADIMP